MQPGMEIVNYKWCTFQCLISKYENLAGKKDEFGKKKVRKRRRENQY